MHKDYNYEWQRNDDTITISKDYFEHLLNCLANQKFVGELPINGDSLATDPSEYQNTQSEIQKAIDVAYHKGRFILGLNGEMQRTYEEMMKKYRDIWNESISLVTEYIKNDSEEYTQDENISFKWQHLVSQEIEMWMRLCCFPDSSIDLERRTYHHGFVSKDDFQYIVQRRGFTPKMKSFLLDMLIKIGIWNG